MLPTSAERAATVDCGELYGALRQEMIGVIRAASPEELERFVAASPAWRVRDVLAHVTGIAYDLNRGDLEGDTERQVARHRDDPVEDVIDEWDAEAPGFEDGLRLFGYPIGSHFVGDLHAHLQDVRSTLGLSRHDDDATVLVALDFYLESLDAALLAEGAGRVTAVVGDEVHVAGSGEPLATLTATPFEVLRTLSGRRSLAQVLALDWTGDATALAPTLSRYPMPEVDLTDG